MADNPKKRKKQSDSAPTPKRPRFQGKPQHKIGTPSTTTAYPNGELNVSHFLRAHENEIKALEGAMKVAKKGLTRRAFQDVPRDLRRRTGSHNPQRVPKRLRMQARKEAKEDNTPISKNKSGSGIGKGKKKWLRVQGIEIQKKTRRKKKVDEPNKVTITDEPVADDQVPKNGCNEPKKVAPGRSEARTKRKKTVTLASPLMPPSRFRRRQLHKTWLPTHVWHAKRATMTPPKEPLWRFSIPLTPVVKGYRLAHRAASFRGAVAWDTSYIATIGLEGVEASIIGLLRALHFAEEDGEDDWTQTRRGRKWMTGVRAREGWVYERESEPLQKIAPITVMWRVGPDVTSNKRKVIIRVHPIAFLQLWNEVIRASRVQKPSVTVEDLRFEVGSIDATGPAAAETLCSILTPSASPGSAAVAPHSIWPNLTSLTDVGALPADALLAFNISDPRLRDPWKTAVISYDPESQAQLTQTLADWPIDKAPATSQMFDRNARLAAGRTLPSQKSINRRKSAALPGQYPEARSTDPHIPVLVYVSKAQNRWTVLLPWKCVLPVWQCIMRYPVSTGGNPRFGGLKETRQISYERSMPSFPFDFPGTDAGWTWELQQREVRQKEWTKKPKGKRIEWTTIDLGNDRKGEIGDPWACDWSRLIAKAENQEQRQGSKTKVTSPPFRQLHSTLASQLLAGLSPSTAYISSPHLFTVKINMVQHGVPTECARIYRLPTKNGELRTKWLSLMPGPTQNRMPKRSSKKDSNPNSKPMSLPKHLRTRALAASLLKQKPHAKEPLKVGSAEYPVVPDEVDLIGFVTTGNYNLAEGMPSAIASIALHRVVEEGSTEAVNKDGHVCIVREAGRTFGRLGTWVVV
jgi:ribonuclease P/MRP protein subunit POP1